MGQAGGAGRLKPTMQDPLALRPAALSTGPPDASCEGRHWDPPLLKGKLRLRRSWMKSVVQDQARTQTRASWDPTVSPTPNAPDVTCLPGPCPPPCLPPGSSHWSRFGSEPRKSARPWYPWGLLLASCSTPSMAGGVRAAQLYCIPPLMELQGWILLSPHPGTVGPCKGVCSEKSSPADHPHRLAALVRRDFFPRDPWFGSVLLQAAPSFP